MVTDPAGLVMKLDRRHFLTLVSAAIGSPVLAVGENSSDTTALFLSAASDSDDQHWVIGFELVDGKSAEKFRHLLPARAHHIAVHEALGVFVVIARRPGNYLWVGDLHSGEPLAEITVPVDRHLYGHGVFSEDGRHFYAPENAWQLINGDSGRVVAWQVSRDSQGFSMVRAGDFPSYGTGPHELLLKPDQNTLVVANGGIRTHPERPREKLNIPSMEPSLVYMDAVTGELQEQHMLDAEYHQASIRHIDQNAFGQVVIGMQYEGEPFDSAPLLALHEQGKPLQLLWAPEPQQGQMKQYIGSVRYDRSGRFFAASSPRGNMISFWDVATGEMKKSLRSRDGCGLCAIEQGFLFTAGSGRITQYDLVRDEIEALNTGSDGKVFWDNHLSMIAR